MGVRDGAAVSGMAGAARGACGGATGVSVPERGKAEGNEAGGALPEWPGWESTKWLDVRRVAAGGGPMIGPAFSLDSDSMKVSKRLLVRWGQGAVRTKSPGDVMFGRAVGGRAFLRVTCLNSS